MRTRGDHAVRRGALDEAPEPILHVLGLLDELARACFPSEGLPHRHRTMNELVLLDVVQHEVLAGVDSLLPRDGVVTVALLVSHLVLRAELRERRGTWLRREHDVTPAGGLLRELECGDLLALALDFSIEHLHLPIAVQEDAERDGPIGVFELWVRLPLRRAMDAKKHDCEFVLARRGLLEEYVLDGLNGPLAPSVHVHVQPASRLAHWRLVAVADLGVDAISLYITMQVQVGPIVPQERAGDLPGLRVFPLEALRQNLLGEVVLRHVYQN
mmetsp:Transcript_5025/g.12536  ORF Transcript_5025/g.12536 Transcript_5025/m.12536 type:complete len:271 (+) Transcript_5025:202-1014(+)